MKKFIFSILFLTLFSSISFAEELIWHKKQKNLELIYVLVPENGFWNVNLYSVRPGELQERKWHKAFSSEEKAKKFLSKFLSHKELNTKNTVFDNYFGSNYATTEDQNEVVWKSDNQWSWDWEVKYHEWLKTNFNKNFYIDNKVATDCADGATAIRWIYSRIHKLPAGNTLAGTGVVFTNETMKDSWKKLPTDEDWRKDKRFIAALDYVLDNTYTHTVIKDGYPIALTKEGFLAGTYLVTLQGESGHTMIIGYVSNVANGQIPIRVLSSTGGRIVRALWEQPFWGDLSEKGKSGILKPRWPMKVGNKFELVPAEKMPHYSEEQYDKNFPGDFKDFNLKLYDRIVPGFKPENLVTEGIEQLFRKFPERARLVKEGYEFCKVKGCPEGTSEWEEWSTPQRDQGLLDYFNSLEKVVGLVSQMNANIKNIWTEAISARIIKLNDIETTLKQLLYVWRYNLFDSHPNVPINQRWGVGVQESVQAFVHRVNQLLTKRDQLITQIADSAEVDNQIQRYYIGLIQFCENLPNNCEYLRYVLREKILSFGRQNMNLTAWLERSLWFNSDPRVSFDYRWGKLHSVAVPIHGLITPNSIISRNEILLGGNDENRQYYDLKNRKAVDLPSGFIAEDLEVTQGLAIVINQNQNQIGVLVPRSQKLVILDVPGIPVKVRWRGPQVLMGRTTTNIVFAAKFDGEKFSGFTSFEADNDQIARLLYDTQFKNAMDGVLAIAPKNIFHASHEKNKYTIYDYSGDDVKKTAIDHVFPNKVPAENIVAVTHTSSTHYLVVVTKTDVECPYDQNCSYRGSYAVNKADGTVTYLPFRVGKHLGKNTYILESSSWKRDKSAVFIATLDESFKIQSQSASIGTSCTYSNNPFFTLWKGNGSEINVLRMKDDLTFEEIFKGSLKSFPYFVADGHVIVGMENKAGLYDLATNKMVFETPWLWAAEGYSTDQSPWYFAGDKIHSGLYRINDNDHVPVVTGLSSYLAYAQACGYSMPMPIGVNFEFESEMYPNCNADRNDGDGMIFQMTSGRAYYLPANAHVK